LDLISGQLPFGDFFAAPEPEPASGPADGKNRYPFVTQVELAGPFCRAEEIATRARALGFFLGWRFLPLFNLDMC
jgi:hypothetical protein